MMRSQIDQMRAQVLQLIYEFKSNKLDDDTNTTIDSLQKIIDNRGEILDRAGIQERNSIRIDPSNQLFVSPKVQELRTLFDNQSKDLEVPDNLKAKAVVEKPHDLLMQRYRHDVLVRTLEELKIRQQELQARHDAIKAQPVQTGGDPRGIAPLIVILTPEQQAKRDGLVKQIKALSQQQAKVDAALKLPRNRNPNLVVGDTLASFNQYAVSANLNSYVQKAADQLTHDILIQDPSHTEFLKEQAAADSALGHFEKTNAGNFEKQAADILAHLKNIEKALPEENSQHFARHKTYNALAKGVPEFDRYIHTYFAEKGIPMGKGFRDVFDKLETLLYDTGEGINALISKVDILSKELTTSGTLSKNAIKEKSEELEAAISKLKDKAQEFNEFLLRHSVRDDKGLSILSIIHQNKLDEMANFAERLLKDTETKAKRYKAFQLTAADFVKVFDPAQFVKSIYDAGNKALDNRDSQVLVGTADSNRSNRLVSNPAILDVYGKDCFATLHSGTGFTGFNHCVEEKCMIDNNGDPIQLPIFGDEYSIIKLVNKVFPDNPQKHMRWSDDGKTLYVTWHDDKEKEKWLSELKKGNGEYLKAKKKSEAKEVEATLKVPKPKEPVEATLKVSQRRPSFTEANRQNPPATEEQPQPPAITASA